MNDMVLREEPTPLVESLLDRPDHVLSHIWQFIRKLTELISY